MIRYKVHFNGLRAAVDAKDSGWRKEAQLRLDAFFQAGKYDDDLLIPKEGGGTKKASAIWSDIKPVFMRIQHEKCAYCERQLSSEEWGRGEHDLEHYRPKSGTKPWKVPAGLSDENISLTPPIAGSVDPGYHLLSYHLSNYCAACKTCNSGLKSNEFPIEGLRDPAGDNPRRMKNEKALLLFPIGSVDEDDPEDIIEFYGLLPRAKTSSGRKRRRALVTIAFFELDNPLRKELFRERADVITKLWSYLGHHSTPGDVWQELIDYHTSEKAPHTNCARSYIKLFHADPNKAEALFRDAAKFLATISSS